MTSEQKEAILDAAFMLESVDDYNKLPPYGKGRQYAALAEKLRELVEKDG